MAGIFFQITPVTVTVVAADIIAGLQPENRPATITIQNRGAQSIFIGDVGVTTATGVEVFSGGEIEIVVKTSAKKIYALTAAATADVRIVVDLESIKR